MRSDVQISRASSVRLFLLVTACLGIAACGSSGGRVAATGGTPPLVLGPEGLLAGNTGQEVGFGRAYDGAVAAVNALARETPARIAPINGCRAADLAVTYDSGLVLLFLDGSLEGWRVSGDADYATANGVRLGQKPVDAGTATTVPEGIDVTLDSASRVAALAAGARCGTT